MIRMSRKRLSSVCPVCVAGVARIPESSRIWHQAEQQDLGRPDLFTHKPQHRCWDRSRVLSVQRTGIWWCFPAWGNRKAPNRSFLLHLLSSLSIDPVCLMMIDLTSESITLSLSLWSHGWTLVSCPFLLQWVVLPAFSQASSPALSSIQPFNSHLCAPHLIMSDRVAPQWTHCPAR